MIRESLHQPVEIVYKKLDEGHVTGRQNTFFQMAYIFSGKGLISVNGNQISYHKGSLLLLTPDVPYQFDLSVPTEFLFVNFSNIFLKEYGWKHRDCLECLLYYAPKVSGCVMRSKSDMLLVKQIADSLLQEMKGNKLYNKDLTLHFVNALIVIAARNISLLNPDGIKPNADNRIQNIIYYIQENINSPSKLRASLIAKEFRIAETYLGSFFKQQCGESIQHYIANYRLRLIEHRLKFSDMRINEIVDEFGFTDESHLNRFFKKHRGVNLSGYRKINSLQH
jgi:AraC family transcriptional regulator, transcriptional activator of pobA